jgi:hypothetical protein
MVSSINSLHSRNTDAEEGKYALRKLLKTMLEAIATYCQSLKGNLKFPTHTPDVKNQNIPIMY